MSIKWGNYSVPSKDNINYFVDYKGRSDCVVFKAEKSGQATQYFAATKNTKLVTGHKDRLYNTKITLVKNNERYYFIEPLNKLYIKYKLKYIRDASVISNYRGSDRWSGNVDDEWRVNNYYGCGFSIYDYKFRYKTHDYAIRTNTIGNIDGASATGGWGWGTSSSSALCGSPYCCKLNGKKIGWKDDNRYPHGDTGNKVDASNCYFTSSTSNNIITYYMTNFKVYLVNSWSSNNTITIHASNTSDGWTNGPAIDSKGTHDNWVAVWKDGSSCARIASYYNNDISDTKVIVDSSTGSNWHNCGFTKSVSDAGVITSETEITSAFNSCKLTYLEYDYVTSNVVKFPETTRNHTYTKYTLHTAKYGSHYDYLEATIAI